MSPLNSDRSASVVIKYSADSPDGKAGAALGWTTNSDVPLMTPVPGQMLAENPAGAFDVVSTVIAALDATPFHVNVKVAVSLAITRFLNTALPVAAFRLALSVPVTVPLVTDTVTVGDDPTSVASSVVGMPSSHGPTALTVMAASVAFFTPAMTDGTNMPPNVFTTSRDGWDGALISTATSLDASIAREPLALPATDATMRRVSPGLARHDDETGREKFTNVALPSAAATIARRSVDGWPTTLASTVTIPGSVGFGNPSASVKSTLNVVPPRRASTSGCAASRTANIFTSALDDAMSGEETTLLPLPLIGARSVNRNRNEQVTVFTN